ncbi:MAG: hypothetical protein WEB52_10590 [Dehalococcoidia bacterium]
MTPPATTVLESQTAKITVGDSHTKLEMSLVVFTAHSVAAGQSPEISYYDAGSMVDGARYPSLAAVWENDEDDAAFADL